MSTLVFFPWLIIDKEVSIGDFCLIPYERGKSPTSSKGSLQHTIDDILEPYVERNKVPIPKATLLKIKDKDLISDLAEEEVNGVFIFSEQLAIAGLSKRSFFISLPLEYCNRDIFRVVIQRFKDPNSGVTRVHRRRDGNLTVFTTKEALIINKPEYLAHPYKLEWDTNLLEALIEAQRKYIPDQWGSFFESVSNYNLANTDSDYITEQLEAVLLIGAFERLFQITGRENELAKAFSSTLTPIKTKHPSDCDRLSKREVLLRFKNSESIRDMWLRDFFRLRGNLSHGIIEPEYPSIWSLRDHLLLASFVFPLLIKVKLQRHDLYKLTSEDKVHINVFEELACYEHCVTYKNDDPPTEYPWNRIMFDAMFDAMDYDDMDEKE